MRSERARITRTRQGRGIRANAARGVSVQGNTLVSEAVVANALTAYLADDPKGMKRTRLRKSA